MTITGKLHKVMETKQVSDKFKNREIIIATDTDGKYPQYISCILTQDKVSLMDSYQLGSEVTISVNLRGREWTNPQGEVKYFNTIEAWKIEGGKVSNDEPF